MEGKIGKKFKNEASDPTTFGVRKAVFSLALMQTHAEESGWLGWTSTLPVDVGVPGTAFTEARAAVETGHLSPGPTISPEKEPYQIMVPESTAFSRPSVCEARALGCHPAEGLKP